MKVTLLVNMVLQKPELFCSPRHPIVVFSLDFFSLITMMINDSLANSVFTLQKMKCYNI